MSITNMDALRKWNKIPKAFQQRLLKNVYCMKCDVTTVTDYTFKNHDLGIVIEGKCKTCGGDVARLVEDT